MSDSREPRHFERLSFDIIFHIVQYLSFQDVCALSATGRSVFDLCNSCEVWGLLARGLLDRGIGLPTNGFQSPGDLSPVELRMSVTKAHKLNHKWTQSCANYTNFTSFDARAPHRREIAGVAFQFTEARKAAALVPITSKFLLVIDISNTCFAVWDVSDMDEPKMVSSISTQSPQHLLAHRIDLKSRCAFLLVGPERSKGGAHAASLMRIKDATRFEIIATYPSFGEHGFIRVSATLLDTSARRLCIVYARNARVFLYVVLNWESNTVAFVDTNIDVPTPEDGYMYDCCLIPHLQSINMRWEKWKLSYHGPGNNFSFKLSSLYPHAIHASELRGDRLNDPPMVKPELALPFPPPVELPNLQEYIIQVVPPTPWHTYGTFNTPKAASIFHSLTYSHFGFTHYYSIFDESEGSYEEKHDFYFVGQLSAQFGAAAWADRSVIDNVYELRVARYEPWSPKPGLRGSERNDDGQGDENEMDDEASDREEPGSAPCLLSLPPVLREEEGLAFANIALDNVHGKIYFALPSGKVYVVTYV